jgi:hypothetical protein
VTIDPYLYGPPEYEPDDSEAQQAADVFADAAAEGPLFGPVYPHCWHCHDHSMSVFGSETLTADGSGHTQGCYHCHGDQR